MNAPHFQPWKSFGQTDPFTTTTEVNLYVGQGETSVITKGVRNKVLEGEGEKYCVWVNLYPSADKIQDFKTCIAGNKTGTDTTEDNALQYTWGENTKPEFASSFHFFEVYAGESGFKEHSAASHFGVWEEFAGQEGAFAKEPEVFFGKII